MGSYADGMIDQLALPVAPPSEMNRLFDPRSIAIVGASGKQSSMTARPLEYLIASGYEGDIYPVNPRYEEISGLTAYPSLDAIGADVDLVLVADTMSAARHAADRGLIDPASLADIQGQKLEDAAAPDLSLYLMTGVSIWGLGIPPRTVFRDYSFQDLGVHVLKALVERSKLDPQTPLLAIATQGAIYDKVVSNVAEARARSAPVIAVATEGDEHIDRYAHDVIYVPETPEAISPVIAVLPLQSRTLLNDLFNGLFEVMMKLTSGIIRDVFTAKVDALTIEGSEVYNEVKSYLDGVDPELMKRVHLYVDPVPLFDKYGIEDAIREAFQRRVDLPSGGYIIIEPTEALVSIDVNTGRYTGKKDPEKTILRTNLDAAKEIARQLRLRDIGGIIVCDFIDMETRANQDRVLQELRQHLARDRARTRAFQVSELGLIEMTRQRRRPSLYQTATEPCEECAAAGRVLQFTALSRKIERQVRKYKGKLLIKPSRKSVARLKRMSGRPKGEINRCRLSQSNRCAAENMI